jgi:hypothetical protein
MRYAFLSFDFYRNTPMLAAGIKGYASNLGWDQLAGSLQIIIREGAVNTMKADY